MCISLWSIMLSFVHCVTLNRKHVWAQLEQIIHDTINIADDVSRRFYLFCHRHSRTASISCLPSFCPSHCLSVIIRLVNFFSGWWECKKGFLISRINQLSVRKGFVCLWRWFYDDWWPPGSGGGLHNGDFFNAKPDKLQIHGPQWWMTFKSSPVASRTSHNVWSIAWSSQFTLWWTIKCAHDAVLIGSRSCKIQNMLRRPRESLQLVKL